VAHIKGRKSHEIVQYGLRILLNLDHRGATGADTLFGDGAGMLRSFDYAAAVGKAPHPDWLPAVRSAFEEGYRLGRQETGSLTPSPAASGDQEQAEASYQTVLTCLELDKALYEAVYEARNRPDWLGIPMAGIESVLSKHAEG